jgi:hypothetical protein
MQSPDWVSRPEACRSTGLSRAAIDRAVAAQEIESRRAPGGYPRLRRADVERYAAMLSNRSASARGA